MFISLSQFRWNIVDVLGISLMFRVAEGSYNNTLWCVSDIIRGPEKLLQGLYRVGSER